MSPVISSRPRRRKLLHARLAIEQPVAHSETDKQNKPADYYEDDVHVRYLLTYRRFVSTKLGEKRTLFRHDQNMLYRFGSLGFAAHCLAGVRAGTSAKC